MYCDLLKETILDAQKNISQTTNEEQKDIKKEEKPKLEKAKEIKKLQVKEDVKKKDKAKRIKKISKSIISKVNSLGSGNSK